MGTTSIVVTTVSDKRDFTDTETTLQSPAPSERY